MTLGLMARERAKHISVPLVVIGLAIFGCPWTQSSPLFGPARVYAAEKQHTTRADVGNPVKAAQKQITQKRYSQALQTLKQAEAVSKKSAYENFIIYETQAAAYRHLGDERNAIRAMEAGLNTGMLSNANTRVRLENLTQLSFKIGDYASVKKYSDRYYRGGGTSDLPRLLVVRGYYEQKDYARTIAELKPIIRAEERRGEKPDEALLLLVVNSEYKTKNKEGYRDALTKLAEHYPSAKNWRTLLLETRQEMETSAHVNLALGRLMLDTGAMTTPEDYTAFAERLILKRLPAEAETTLRHGFATGILGKSGDVARQQRLLSRAQQDAQADKRALPTDAQAAWRSLQGETLVEIGMRRASMGDHKAAIEAIKTALQGTTLKDRDGAIIDLATVYVRSGQPALARKALAEVTPKNRRLANLWALHAMQSSKSGPTADAG